MEISYSIETKKKNEITFLYRINTTFPDTRQQNLGGECRCKHTFVYFCKSKHGKSYQKHQGQQKIKGHTTRKSIKNTYINNELKVLRGRV